MTEKELKRLSKLEIIDILIAQDEEIEELQKKIESLEEQLKRSNEVIDKALGGKSGIVNAGPVFNWRQTDAEE